MYISSVNTRTPQQMGLSNIFKNPVCKAVVVDPNPHYGRTPDPGVKNRQGCGSSMDRVPDCSPAVPGFDPSLGQIWHPQPWRPSLGKRTRGALNLRQMWKHCADLGRGGGRLSRRRRDNCSESRWRHQA